MFQALCLVSEPLTLAYLALLAARFENLVSQSKVGIYNVVYVKLWELQENPVSLRARIVQALCAGLKEVFGARGGGAAWAPPHTSDHSGVTEATLPCLIPKFSTCLPSLLTSLGMQWDVLVQGYLGAPLWPPVSVSLLPFPNYPFCFHVVGISTAPHKALPAVHIHPAQLWDHRSYRAVFS